MRSWTRYLIAAATTVVVVISAGCDVGGRIAGSLAEDGGGGAALAAANPAGLSAAPLVIPPELASAPFDAPRQVLLAPGWTMTVWARVAGARMATWAPDGALLVSRPGAGQVVRLSPNGEHPPTASVLLAGLRQPHGLAFDGATLYVARSDGLDAYHYADGQASGWRGVISGLPDAKSPELGGAYAHALKSVVIGPDKSVYVSVGSTGNISAQDRQANPQRASILRLPPNASTPEVFARGVRNGTGLAIAPDGSVWTAVNNRDDIAYPYPRPYGDATRSAQGKVIAEYVAEHPPEELAKLFPGRDLGWPYCNPDPDIQPGVAGSPQRDSAPPFVPDIQTNADGGRLDCDRLPPIERTFGAHSAPLGMSFTSGLPAPYQNGALIAIHGSWDRTPPQAPEVSFFPWANGTLGSQLTLVGGFQASDGSRWGRPVAAVRGPDGAIYITDDTAGAVYRLAPPAG